jgi:hypothetical protein
MMEATAAVDVKEVEYRVAELSELTGVGLKLEKSRVFQHYHVYTQEADGSLTGWVTRPLSEVFYIINVCLALEQERIERATTHG